jgi:site-specific recombinase XerD
MKKTAAILKLRAAQLQAGHLRNTRKTYRHWLCRYIDGAHAGRYSDLQGFLDELSAGPNRVGPKTVKQALNALVFFYRKVLEKEVGKLRVPKVNKNRNTPTYLNHNGVITILSRMRGTARLQAAMLYATGSRINALLTLRLKDLDLDRGTVTFRFDKGGKSRTVKLANSLLPELRTHVEYIRGRWEQDHRAGLIAPHPEPSMMRKIGRKKFGELAWYWLFPSQKVREGCRWRATDRGLAKVLGIAVKTAGIMKRVTPHTLRHSHATALLDRGENIRRIQDQLGHTDVKTTEIYTHVTGREAVASPLDCPPAFQPGEIIDFPTIEPARKAQ